MPKPGLQALVFWSSVTLTVFGAKSMWSVKESRILAFVISSTE